MSSKAPHGRVIQRLLLDTDTLTGGIVVATFWAGQIDHEPLRCALERRLLTPVVHARLAKMVVGIGACALFLQRKSKDIFGEGYQFVALPICCPLYKIHDLLFELSYAVFQRVFRINARLQFLVELKAGRCDIKKYPGKTLLYFGDLVIVSSGDSNLGEVDQGFQACDRANQVHTGSPNVEKGCVRTPDSTLRGNYGEEGA